MRLNKKILLIVIVGVILRLVIAMFTYHPDTRTSSFTSAMAFREGTLNFYDFSSNLDTSDPRKNEYNQKLIDIDDQPLQYLVTLPFFAILRPFVDPVTEIRFHLDPSSTFGTPQLFYYLLYLKFPFLVFDILTAFVLMKFFQDKKQKVVAFTLWMFNPVTLWATAGIGQFDILTTFFMILSLLFLSKNKPSLSAITLGFGIALKTFPLLLLPFLILSQKTLKQKIVVTILSLAPFVGFALTYLGSSGYRQHALFAPQLDKLLYAKLPLSGGESIFIVPAILLVLYLIFNSVKNKSWEMVGKFWFIALLISLGLTHFHAQWFLWVTPFLIIFYPSFKSKFILPVLLLLISWLVMLFMFDASLQVKLFAPLIPSLKDAAGLAEVLTGDKVSFIRSIAATIFVASGFYIAVKFLKND